MTIAETLIHFIKYSYFDIFNLVNLALLLGIFAVPSKGHHNGNEIIEMELFMNEINVGFLFFEHCMGGCVCVKVRDGPSNHPATV